MNTQRWPVRHPGIGVLYYDSEEEARVAAGTAGELLPPSGEITWAREPRGAFRDGRRSIVEILRWEDPPPAHNSGYPRGSNELAEAVAAQLRLRPGQWAVVYDGPKSAASGLTTYIRTGSLGAFTPSGDYDATARLIGNRRVVYARYVGDGEEFDG